MRIRYPLGFTVRDCIKVGIMLRIGDRESD